MLVPAAANFQLTSADLGVCLRAAMLSPGTIYNHHSWNCPIGQMNNSMINLVNAAEEKQASF